MKRAGRVATSIWIASILTIAWACASGSKNAANKTASNANTSQSQPLIRNPAQSGTGSIEVTSTPPGVSVLLISSDEGGAGEPQPRGVTPTTITGLTPGKYTVDLEKPGYKYFQQIVVVKENTTAKVNATLKKS